MHIVNRISKKPFKHYFTNQYHVLSLFIIILTCITTQHAFAETILAIEIKSSRNDTSQLFYDTGSGYTEIKSIQCAVFASNEFQKIQFKIPEDKITALRLDPFEKFGFGKIRNAVITKDGKDFLVPLNSFKPVNDIPFSKIEDNIFNFETHKIAIDPQLEIKIDDYLSFQNKSKAKQNNIIDYMSLLLISLVLVSIFTIIFYYKRGKIISALTNPSIRNINANPTVQLLNCTSTGPRCNSFDIMRFFAACAVIYGHHTALDGGKEPALPLIKDNLAGFAVCIFFSISGYLIFNSLQRNSQASIFFAARLVRIVPNLIVSLVIVSLFTMVFFNNYHNYDAHLEYIYNNLCMFFYGVQYTIPGVFEGRPIPGPNGSLWTLPYEFWLYVALYTIFLLRKDLQRLAVLLAFTSCALLWINSPAISTFKFFTFVFQSASLGKLGTYFFAGSIAAAFFPLIESRKITWAVCLIALGSASSIVLGAANPILAFAISFLSIITGLSSWGSWFDKGDPSYGMYIFGFPIQQIALMVFDDFYVSLAFSIFFSICIGYVTYWGFERRCIGARNSLAIVLRWPFR